MIKWYDNISLFHVGYIGSTKNVKINSFPPFVAGKFGNPRDRNSETVTGKPTNCSGITSVKTILASNISEQINKDVPRSIPDNVALDSLSSDQIFNPVFPVIFPMCNFVEQTSQVETIVHTIYSYQDKMHVLDGLHHQNLPPIFHKYFLHQI